MIVCFPLVICNIYIFGWPKRSFTLEKYLKA
jgi:hypothetical protein